MPGVSPTRPRRSHSQPALTRQLLGAISGRRSAVLCGRGAAGLWAILRVFGWTQRKILLPANTCYIVLWAVLESGNIPLLVDVNPDSANLDPAALNAAQVDDAAAVIPAHMYGLPAPMEAISTWAKPRGLTVIEDAALALGGSADGKPAGSWGDAAIYSFGLGKIADNQLGGAVVTDDVNLAREVSRLLDTTPLWNEHLRQQTNQWNNLYWALHQHDDQNPSLTGLYPPLFEIYRGLTGYRLPASAWSELPPRLSRLEQNRQRRSQMAALYDQQLRDLPVRSLPRPDGTMLWRYPLLVEPERRNDLLAALWENGVHAATRWYPSLRPMASALLPAVVQPPTPHADGFGASIINLPVDQTVSEADVLQIGRIIAEFFEQN